MTHLLPLLSKYKLPLILLAAVPVLLLLPRVSELSFLVLTLQYAGIFIILTVSLNLVNGYLGEFSVGHAGFMAIGAYTAAPLTARLFSTEAGPYLFPLALIAGGAAAGLAGLLLSVPSFRTRGDYLAIITLAFNMIVKSGLENTDALGGAQGFMGIPKLTSLLWVYIWVILTLVLARNFIYSRFGRGVLSVREDELASGLVGVHTRQVKVMTFVLSAFLAGIAGGLFAHVIQFINPGSFTIARSTDMLVMVYLGGVGSLSGSILGGLLFALLDAGLRYLLPMVSIPAVWQQVLIPVVLILLMLFRPRGIMGGREFRFLAPPKANNL